MHISYAQRHSSRYETLLNCDVRSYRNFIDLGLLSSGSVHKSVLRGYFCYEF